MPYSYRAPCCNKSHYLQDYDYNGLLQQTLQQIPTDTASLLACRTLPSRPPPPSSSRKPRRCHPRCARRRRDALRSPTRTPRASRRALRPFPR
ncbi:hypothetical protein K523DRAFT_408218, partial [Schizophyllum commune Tattone D]